VPPVLITPNGVDITLRVIHDAPYLPTSENDACPSTPEFAVANILRTCGLLDESQSSHGLFDEHHPSPMSEASIATGTGFPGAPRCSRSSDAHRDDVGLPGAPDAPEIPHDRPPAPSPDAVWEEGIGWVEGGPVPQGARGQRLTKAMKGLRMVLGFSVRRGSTFVPLPPRSLTS